MRPVSQAIRQAERKTKLQNFRNLAAPDGLENNRLFKEMTSSEETRRWQSQLD